MTYYPKDFKKNMKQQVVYLDAQKPNTMPPEEPEEAYQADTLVNLLSKQEGGNKAASEDQDFITPYEPPSLEDFCAKGGKK